MHLRTLSFLPSIGVKAIFFFFVEHKKKKKARDSFFPPEHNLRCDKTNNIVNLGKNWVLRKTRKTLFAFSGFCGFTEEITQAANDEDDLVVVLCVGKIALDTRSIFLR